MKKLHLVTVTYQIDIGGNPNETFSQCLMVCVHNVNTMSEDDQKQLAVDHVQKVWVNDRPNMKYISIIAEPTLQANVLLGEGHEESPKKAWHSPFNHAGWNDISEPPKSEQEVLIDVDGERNIFVVGFYNQDTKEWYTDSKDKVFEGGKWCYLPYAKNDK